jgi:radical SAM superfamily enzyme YgiQ (UPF0313 family)
MKVLLIEPAKSPMTLGGEDVSLFEPLALEYVAAGVAEHHDVQILDMRIDDTLEETLIDFKPDVVGLTAYTVHVKPVRKLCKRVKAWNPEVLTVVGGHHATVAAADFVSPHIDLVVKGEGVEPFRQITARHETGKGFDGIAGVEVCEGDRLVSGPEQAPFELDAAPMPMRSLTAGYRGSYYSEWLKPLATMRTSKGCPYRCSFCAQWKTARGRYLKRSIDAIVEELATIDEKCVFFADDESLVDVERMRTLAQLIKEAKLRKRLFFYGRSDTIARHPDLLEAWREAGLERIFVGFEFFRDDDLEYVGKGTTVKDNTRAVKVLKELDIDIYASFIVRPEFDYRDFHCLRHYIRKLELDFATFAVLTPLPGTDLYDQLEHRLLTHDTDFYDFLHTVLPTTLPMEEFFDELMGLYRFAVPPTRQMTLLKKWPIGEWPAVFGRSYRTFKRFKTLAGDYESAVPADPPPSEQLAGPPPARAVGQ